MEQRKYKVITLCGSTRFKDEFMEAQKRLTLEGNIVISVGLFGHSGDNEVWENMDEDTLTETKLMLDDMHKRKIDMSDEIFVINVGGYIGDSTKSEILYAKAHGKPVRYLENLDGSAGEVESNSLVLETGAIDVTELPISKRLMHILIRGKIYDLRDISKYAKGELLKARNMGSATFTELENICKSYNIHIYSHEDLDDEDNFIYFGDEPYLKLFKAGIRCKEDLTHISSAEIMDKFNESSTTTEKLIKLKRIMKQTDRD